MKNPVTAVSAWSRSHKFGSTLIMAVVIVGGFGMYRSATTAKAATQYVLSPVTTGNIIQTVSGSGQVSAANQIDVTPQVSGAITGIDVSVGQHVNAGDLLATIDDTNALNSLNNAKLSFAQLTEAAKPGDVTNAQNAVAKSYSDGFNSVASTFTDLQTVMPGLNDMLYSQTGFLSDQHITLLSVTAQNYRNTAGMEYDKTNIEYKAALDEYKGLSRSSATSSIQQLITDTDNLARDVANTLQQTQTTVTWIASNQPEYDKTGVTSAEGSVTGWSNSVNGDVSSLSSASDSIASNINSLNNLETGADPLAVQAGQISLEQAQQSYDNYFIRAPFSGTIGRIPANVYSQAGGSTVIATVVGDQKLAVISLDEVDAANVKVGQKATVTFDAINNLTASGTVSEVDQVGTVSGGVVSFGVKIAIDTVDPRILQGMSLNVIIVTNELDGVTIVPTAAVKASGRQSYVQTIDPATVRSYIQSLAAANGATNGRTGSTTRGYSGTGAGSSTRNYSSTAGGSAFGSTTGGFGGGTASSTRSFTGGFAGGTGTARAAISVTMPSATPPSSVIVTIGQSDTTNTQIVSGLTPGQWVVTRTIAGGSATTATAAPSLLSSLGAGGRGAGGAASLGGGATFRTGGGGGAAPAAASRPAGN